MGPWRSLKSAPSADPLDILLQCKWAFLREYDVRYRSGLWDTTAQAMDFLFSLQIVKIFGEDGMGKVVEIPSNMTARDLCQLLVYKSHCVDDNSWALVEHHSALGLGKDELNLNVQQMEHTSLHTYFNYYYMYLFIYLLGGARRYGHL